MKSLNRKAASFLIAILLLTTAAYAQYAHMKLKVNIPFEFMVGSKTYPAGKYWIARTGPYTLVLRDEQDKFLTLITTSQAQTSATHIAPGLHFRSIEGHLVLVEVWQGGANTGFELYPGKHITTAVAQQHPAGPQVAADTHVAATTTK